MFSLRKFLTVLQRKAFAAKVFVIPGLLFFVDISLRLVLRINLADAGADMALLAVGSFITMLSEDDVLVPTYILLIFLLIFLTSWILSLGVLTSIGMRVAGIDVRLVASWFVGLVSFILSGILVDELSELPALE